MPFKGEIMEKKKTWNRGRLGICNDGKGKNMTFKICPSTEMLMNEFCKMTSMLKSVLVNKAIVEFIKNQKGE